VLNLRVAIHRTRKRIEPVLPDIDDIPPNQSLSGGLPESQPADDITFNLIPLSCGFKTLPNITITSAATSVCESRIALLHKLSLGFSPGDSAMP
jgi:hypothetical protein